MLAQNITVANTSWPTTSCTDGWNYDFAGEVHFETISTELDWVCERDTYPSYIQAIFFIGAIAGGFFFGYIGDRYGRMPALVVANFIGCVGGLCTPFTTTFWEVMVVRFICGMAYDNCFTMIYIVGKFNN